MVQYASSSCDVAGRLQRHSTGRTAYPHILQKKENIDLLMNQTYVILISVNIVGLGFLLKQHEKLPQILKCISVWCLWKWELEHLHCHISLVHQKINVFFLLQDMWECCPSCGMSLESASTITGGRCILHMNRHFGCLISRKLNVFCKTFGYCTLSVECVMFWRACLHHHMRMVPLMPIAKVQGLWLHIIDDIVLGHISANTAWILVVLGLF